MFIISRRNPKIINIRCGYLISMTNYKILRNNSNSTETKWVIVESRMMKYHTTYFIFIALALFNMVVVPILMWFYPENYYYHFDYVTSELGALITPQGFDNHVIAMCFAILMVINSTGFFLIAVAVNYEIKGSFPAIKQIKSGIAIIIAISLIFTALPMDVDHQIHQNSACIVGIFLSIFFVLQLVEIRTKHPFWDIVLIIMILTIWILIAIFLAFRINSSFITKLIAGFVIIIIFMFPFLDKYHDATPSPMQWNDTRIVMAKHDENAI